MNYTYATLLTSDSYLPGIFLLKASMEKVKTKYPLLVMITDNLSKDTVDTLNKLDINILKINKIATPENIYEHNKKINPIRANTWKDVLTKFQVWTLTDYDKVIMCDCDLMFLKNMDYCFDLPNMTAALDGEYFGIWKDWPHFNTGFFVVKPDKKIFKSICKFATTLEPSKIFDAYNRNYVIADQEILNLYFKDWPSKEELHLSKYCNIFACHLHKNSAIDIINKAEFIHFVGGKPWIEFDDEIPTMYSWVSIYPYALARALIILYKEANYHLPDYCDYILLINCLQSIVTYFTDFEEAETLVNYFITLHGETKDLVDLKNHCKDLLACKKEFTLLKPILFDLYGSAAANGNETLKNYSLIYSIEQYDKLLYKDKISILDFAHKIYNKIKIDVFR